MGARIVPRSFRFLRSDATTESPEVAQQGHSHILDQLQTALQIGLTFTMPAQWSWYTLQVTKWPEAWEVGSGIRGYEKRGTSLPTVGTADERARCPGNSGGDQAVRDGEPHSHLASRRCCASQRQPAPHRWFTWYPMIQVWKDRIGQTNNPSQ